MNISRHLRRGTGLVLAIAVLTAVAGVSQAAHVRAAGGSKAEYRALTLRSQALNRIYHLGTYSSRTGITRAESRALVLRSEGLNKKYGLGQFETAAAAPDVTSVDAGFSWAAFGIGAAAVAGLVLLAAGAIAARRSGRQVPRARVS